MSDKTFKSRIVHKHDTETNWNKATNFIPKQGEIIVYDKDSTYSYERFKIGDGSTKVTALPFADAHKANASHTHTKSQITDFPTSLPANGGNADTVDGKHASDFATATGLSDLKSLVGDASVSSQISSAISTKANTSDLTTHTGNTTVHITSTERTNWNAAKTHADSAHAPSNAEANQNAFSNVTVGSTTVAADSKTDTLTLAGSNVTLTPDATNDKITIGITKANVTDALGYTPPTTNTTYGAAGTSLGLVKSGGDVSISSGVITVNDDSHNHVISNVDGLQDALDAKGSASDVSNLKTLVGDTSVSSQISSAIASKSDTGHTHDDRYYTETEINNKLSGKSDTSHTHSSYVNQNAFSNVKVGSSTIAADSATDTLTLTAGNNVTLTADTSGDGVTIAAKDTVYTHPTTSGNKHIPSGGSSGQILRWSADGTAAWGADNNTTYSNATTSTAGLMSSSDKTKLDGIATGATKVTVDSALSSTSTNPVQNKVVNSAISNLNTLVGDTSVTTQINNAIASKADLDTNGKVPSSQLPSYVDDVLEYSVKSNFPSTGESGKIYVDTATNLTYRWSGSAYVEISPTLALGETSSTAYRGDRGKIAYDHSQTAHAPSNANYYKHPTYTAKSSGLYKVTVDGTGHVSAATAVAKSDITGLGIPAQDTTYSVATTSANGLMSSTDKTNLDNLKSLVGDTSVSSQITSAIASKSDTGHTHDNRYYTESEIDNYNLITTSEIDNICQIPTANITVDNQDCSSDISFEEARSYIENFGRLYVYVTGLDSYGDGVNWINTIHALENNNTLINISNNTDMVVYANWHIEWTSSQIEVVVDEPL